MFGSLLSLLLVAMIIFLPLPVGISPLSTSSLILLSTLPFVLFLTHLFLMASAFRPLQKSEQNLTPRVIELFKKDTHFKIVHIVILGFALTSLFLMFESPLLDSISPRALIVMWLLLFGISCDLIMHSIKRTLAYLNPLSAIKMFSQAARLSVANNHDEELCDWVDALAEISIKSINRLSSSVCNYTIGEMTDVLRLFLESSKSISHPIQEPTNKLSDGKDDISFTLLYFLDRFELLYKKALEQNVESVCSSIITSVGKIAIYAAKCDLSLMSYPAYLIGKLSRRAQEHKLSDIALKGTCTLVETSKIIVNDIDLTYMELQDPFLSVLTQLNEIAKESFRQNKNSNIKLLVQPIQDLRNLFQEGKIQTHRDAPLILSAIDAILAEWDSVDAVMRTMPVIPLAPPAESSPAPSS